MARSRIEPGSPSPLGATWDGRGVNFALFSGHAEKVELCLFDANGRKEVERIALPEYTNQIWHGYIVDLHPGQLYGYRVYGPVRAAGRASVQPQQAPDRPLRAGDRGLIAAGGRPFWLPPRQLTGRPVLRPARQCPDHAEVPDRRDGVHVGARAAAERPLVAKRRLRTARSRLHEAAPGGTQGTARHVRRPGIRAGHRAPGEAGRDRRRAAADPSHHRRAAPRAPRPAQLLGLQLGKLFCRRRPFLRPRTGARIQVDGRQPPCCRASR